MQLLSEYSDDSATTLDFSAEKKAVVVPSLKTRAENQNADTQSSTNFFSLIPRAEEPTEEPNSSKSKSEAELIRLGSLVLPQTSRIRIGDSKPGSHFSADQTTKKFIPSKTPTKTKGDERLSSNESSSESDDDADDIEKEEDTLCIPDDSCTNSESSQSKMTVNGEPGSTTACLDKTREIVASTVQEFDFREQSNADMSHKASGVDGHMNQMKSMIPGMNEWSKLRKAAAADLPIKEDVSIAELKDSAWLEKFTRGDGKLKRTAPKQFLNAAFEPSRRQRQKHQINWLAAEAVSREEEQLEKDAQGRFNRYQAQQKYGW